MKDINEYKHSNSVLRDLNYIRIPVTKLDFNNVGAKEWNELVDFVHEAVKDSHNWLKRTSSGAICKKINSTRPPCYDIRNTKGCIELTYLGIEGNFRFQFRNGKLDFEDDNGNIKHISGHTAYIMFKNKCKEFNIKLEDYFIDNGKEIKETIESPYIKLFRGNEVYHIYENVHHIDFHNSYPAGLVNTHPEFKDVVKFYYDNRKNNPENKAVLNYTIGYFQSMSFGAKLAHLSKDAIADNNKRIKDLTDKLIAAGNKILLYNTDGIWYQGNIYHGEGEGTDLGEWSNDHTDCTFRAKSAGSYEYIENGQYKAVTRGTTKLDKIKPREEWKWGDIFNKDAEPIKYRLINEYICDSEGRRIGEEES